MSNNQEPEFKNNPVTEKLLDSFDQGLKEFTEGIGWSDTKEVLGNAVFSTLTKFTTDASVSQYLSEYQKQAIKSYRDKVLTLVSYYLGNPTGKELSTMIEDCLKAFKQIIVTSTADIENRDRFVAEGKVRPMIACLRAIEEARRWIFMDSDDSARERLATIVMDPKNPCGFYSPKVEQIAQITYNNAEVYERDPTPEEMISKGEETLDYYLDRPEIDDFDKLKLQQTPNFKLPLSDVEKLYKNTGGYKTRFNNIFKKAFKDGVVITDEDFKGIKQYLEEYLWYSAKLFSNGEEMLGDPVEGWFKAEAIAEGVYVSLVKAFGYDKMRERYYADIDFQVSYKETLFNGMYLLCLYISQLEDLNIITRVYNYMDDVTDDYGPNINVDLKLSDFFYFIEDLMEMWY